MKAFTFIGLLLIIARIVKFLLKFSIRLLGAMKTIILDHRSTYGGRPQKLGQLIFGDDGRRGITIGYFNDVKIGITDAHLNELLKNSYMSYQVDVSIKSTEKKSLFNFSEFAAKRLIPKSVKDQIGLIN
jgi:hypothetical protein